MNIKAVLSILAAAVLTACGDSSEAVASPTADTSTAAPVVAAEPIAAPIVAATPSPQPVPPNAPEGVLCDRNSYIPCQTPTWIPSPPEPERVVSDRADVATK